MARRTNQQQFPNQTKVGPFLLLDELSNDGNMAWVYRACARQDPNRQVVLKIARADGEMGVFFEQLLQNEVKLLADYRHPGIVHICPIHAYGKTFYVGRGEYLAPFCNGVAPWYFPMELLAGGTLERTQPIIQRLSLAWKLELIYQIALILDYIHLRGLAHMDLKPSNIVFRYTPNEKIIPQPVLIDFGIAEKRALEQVIKAGTMMYASPERVVEMTGIQAPYRITSTHVVNNMPADIWAFGVIAYEILTGQYPFRLGNSKEELARSIIMDGIPSLAAAGMPSQLDNMLQGILAKERDRRLGMNQIIAILDTQIPIPPPRISVG